jgi:hypothetical protein
MELTSSMQAVLEMHGYGGVTELPEVPAPEGQENDRVIVIDRSGFSPNAQSMGCDYVCAVLSADFQSVIGFFRYRKEPEY